jgi:hypothetical protein
MLKLSDGFYITSIDTDNRWSSSKLDQEYAYKFRYKDFRVELSIMFTIMGYTREDNMAIINFGYSVDIDRWSDKEQSFSCIDDLYKEDGKSTKKYLDSLKARELILRFIERRINKYLKTVSPAIVIRGALSDIKVNLSRYTRLDLPFSNHGYHKKEFDIKKSDSLYQIIQNKNNDDKVIWAYSKKIEHFEKLEEVFR